MNETRRTLTTCSPQNTPQRRQRTTLVTRADTCCSISVNMPINHLLMIRSPDNPVMIHFSNTTYDSLQFLLRPPEGARNQKPPTCDLKLTFTLRSDKTTRDQTSPNGVNN